MKVIVDADACPRGCLEAVLRKSHAAGAAVTTVANFSHEIESDCHITVGGDSQAADIKTANLAERGDIVVTQDIGLAAIVLAKGARAIGPTGFEYKEETMDAVLEEREIKAKFRRAGGRTKGPAKRTKEDDRRFAENFEKMLEEKEL